MDEAFRTLWASIHPDLELPTDPEVVNDRELMFAAIAQGLLRYLGDKRQQVATSTESIGGAPGTDHHHDVMFEWKP